MKKKILLLTLSLILSFTVLSQNYQEKEQRHYLTSKQLKSKKFSRLNKNERISHFNVNNKQKKILKYKAGKKKKLDSVISINTDGSGGLGSKFKYNNDGYLTTETFIDKIASNKWSICCKYEYGYNDEGNVILKILNYWNQDDNQWGAPKYKEEYIYNTQGNLVKMLKYDGGIEDNALYSTHEYLYNTEQYLITINSYMGNSNSIDDKLGYTYNTQGYVTSIDDYDWNPSTRQWKTGSIYEYTYDADGNMVQESTLSQNINKQWIETNKLEYTYDTNGNAILFFEYYGSPLELLNKQEYIINTDYSSLDLLMPPNWMDDYVEVNRLNRWNYPNNMMTYFISYTYENQNWVEDSELTLFYSDISYSDIICENLSITNSTYSETDDLNQKVKDEFGDSYAIADWNDLKNMTNLNDWISCMNLQHDQTFMVTRDGDFIYSGSRQYLVHYSTDGIPYSGFLVHDKVGDFYLGSWYGLNMNILAKENERNNISNFKTEYIDLNDNKVPTDWTFEATRSADISNGRMNAYITDGVANLSKEGIVSNSTQEIILEMDAYIAYSYWGLINFIKINSGNKILIFYSGEEDYEFPENQIANFVTFYDGQNGTRIHESLVPSIPGTYHFKLIMNNSGYEFIGTDPNGQESFRIKIDSKDYFDFKEVDKITFGISAHTQNNGWMDNIRITVLSDESICENLSITNSTYSETDDLNQKVKDEFGDSYAIADWNDLKNMTNLNDWISCMNLQHDQTFMVTKNGDFIYSGNRQYYVHYSTDGVPYSGFAVHDKVDNFYLGSWYGISMKILAIQTGALAIDNFDLDKNFNIYPNPVLDVLTIDTKLQIIKVEIYSILGKKIKEIKTNFNAISTHNLSSGIYLVKIASENGTVVKKLIKQ